MGPLEFEVEEGAFCLVLGRNGSGKTTLLRGIYGLLKASGKLNLGNIDLLSGRMDQRRRHMAWIGEEPWCEPTLSVDENLAYLTGLYPDFDRELFDRLVSEGGIGPLDREKLFARLSSAQKLFVQTAFALAEKPKLLLVDEHRLALDLKTYMFWLERIRSQANAEHITVLMANDKLDMVGSLADRVILMKDGKIAACERTDAPHRSVEMQRARLEFRTMTQKEEEDYWAGKDGSN